MNKINKESTLIHISDILNKALQNFRTDDDIHMTRIWDTWEEAVGEPIARNAKPYAFKDNILIVHVSSSAWMHQLSFLEKDMLANLNRQITPVTIKHIRFKIGKIHS